MDGWLSWSELMIDAIGVVDVVEGWSKFLGFDHHLTLRTTACYTVVVFEWSKFFENSNLFGSSLT